MSQQTTPLYEAARMLNLGPQKLFSALRHRKVLTKHNLPYRQYVDQGLKWLAEEFEVQITRETANKCAANGASH